MDYIAITIIAYNRAESLRHLLNSLSCAYYDGDNVPLIISIDHGDNEKVVEVATNFSWSFGEKTIVQQEKNLGLRKHVLSQGGLLNKYDAIVVLEDDITVAPDFWHYTKSTVHKYHENMDIAGISLYSFAVNYHKREPFTPIHRGDDVFFMNCAMSWGQVWMRKQWKEFELWYEKHQDFPYMPHLPKSICSWSDKSWLKYHTRYCIEKNKFFVFPYVSYSTNMNDAGTHIQNKDSIFQVSLLHGRISNLRLPEWSEEVVKYDGFFENKQLYSALDLTEEECCLDLNGTNGNVLKKRYWLTTRVLPYKIIKSYDYCCRPIEANILNGMEGIGIFLYDTYTPSKKIKGIGNPTYLANHFIQNSFLFIREYGFMNTLHDFIQLIKRSHK
jgi:hypothetical protein